MDINELKQKRAALIAEARKVAGKATTEGRGMSADEKVTYDKYFTDIDALAETIKAEERVKQAETQFGGAEPAAQVEVRGSGAQSSHYSDSDEYRGAFKSFLRHSPLNAHEQRALSVGTDSEGGYTVAPVQFEKTVIKAVDNMVALRQNCTIITLREAKKISIPKMSADLDDPTWTTEILTGSADTGLAFGNLDLDPGSLAIRLLVSKTLLRESSIDIEKFIAERFAYKFGTKLENAIINGDASSNSNVGIFNTAHADKIPTTQDVAFASATALDADALVKAKYKLKAPYRGRAKWLFAKSVVQNIALLKDTTNQYLWRPGLTANEPDTLLGLPIIESEFTPSTQTTGLYVGALGDFSNYYVCDHLPLEVIRLNELYAGTNQVGYIGRMESTGKPAVAEAFARLIMA